MEQEKVSMIKHAMHYGVFLGLFWLIKYLFWIGAGFSDFIFIYVYYILNIGTFFLVYIFYLKYRDQEADHPKGFLECVLFTVAMCFFASFFESAIMYAHYEVIHPEFFVEKIVAPMTRMVDMFPYPQDVKTSMVNMANGKAIYIVSNFIQNIFVGFFLSLVIGFITRNKNN